MRIKAVIFDYDDTLVKTITCKWPALQALAREHYGFELSEQTIRRFWGRAFNDLLWGLFGNFDSPQAAYAKYLQVSENFPMQPFPKAAATMRTLSINNKIGILTSSARNLVVPTLNQYFLPEEQYFCLQCCEDSKHSKPDGRVFIPIISVLEKLKIAPSEAIYVGDSLNDFFAASAAKLNFIAVTSGLTTAQEFSLHGAEYITPSINNLTEIINLFSFE